jgi:hypothetical protein
MCLSHGEAGTNSNPDTETAMKRLLGSLIVMGLLVAAPHVALASCTRSMFGIRVHVEHNMNTYPE